MIVYSCLSSDVFKHTYMYDLKFPCPNFSHKNDEKIWNSASSCVFAPKHLQTTIYRNVIRVSNFKLCAPIQRGHNAQFITKVLN